MASAVRYLRQYLHQLFLPHMYILKNSKNFPIKMLPLLHHFLFFFLVARVKVTKANLNGRERYYVVHVPPKWIFQKALSKKTFIKKRNQRIIARGINITCDCKSLQEGKRYLVFGRQDYDNNLFFDNYSLAFQVEKTNKYALETLRQLRKERKSINCPPNYRYFKRYSRFIFK